MSILNPPEVELQKAMQAAAEKGDGSFIIRVTKKNPNSMVPLSVITFNEGTIAHLANLEGWVSRLVGGGEYNIVANHPSNVGLRFVFATNFPGAPFATVNLSAIQAQDWIGPTHVTQVAEQQQQTPVAPLPSYQQPMAFAQPQRTAAMPVSPAMATAFSQMPADAGAQLLSVQRHEAEANAKLAAREAAQAQRETEDRIRREADERERKLKAELEALNRKLDRPAEKTDYVAIFAGLAAVVAPIAKSIMDSNAEARRLASEQSHKLAEMQMQTTRDLAAIQQKANEQQTAMLMKLTERPSTSPEMTAMLELHKASTESQSAMMNQIVNATGMVSKMSIGMIETIADMNAPPEGSPMLDAVKEGVKALGALVGGTDAGARKAIAAQQASMAKATAQPQRPQQAPQPTPAQIQQARERAAQVNAQAAAQQAAHAAQAAAQVPQPAPNQPVTVIPFPAANMRTPPPTATLVAPPPPSEMVVDVTAPQAFGDAEMPDGFANVETKSILDQLDELIRNEHNPAVVATVLFDSLNDPGFKAALEEVDGDPEALLTNRLGIPWCMDHRTYLESLSEEIERVGVERGLFGDEDGGDAPESEKTQ